MIVAILQARMSSSRLPGKVLRPILGRPMLALQIERVRRSRLIDKLIVATSDRADDEPIAALCRSLDVDCYRGSLDDVLDRFYEAARPDTPDTIVRLTGDCPLADPEVIDDGIAFYLENEFDYVSNSLSRSYPVGLDTEVFSFACLQEAWAQARMPSEREHVTVYFRNHPNRYRIGQFVGERDLSHHRWTVDEPEDFRFVSAVYEALYPDDPEFDSEAVLALLERRPELREMNYHIVHGAGFEKSLQEDAAYRAETAVVA